MDINSTQVFSIKKGQELRIKCEFASVRVLCGEVECFGTKLRGDCSYQNGSFPLFSFEGAEVSIQGTFHAEPNCESSALLYHELYKTIHKRECPRVLVAGPCDSGKSSLCRTLISYSTGEGMSLIFVDLDPGQSIFVPGSLVALPLMEGQREGEAPPLAYFYGHTSPRHNPEYFMVSVGNLSQAIDGRLQTDTFKKGGVVVNSCGWIDGLGYTLLKDAIKVLKIETVIILGENSLLESLRADFPESEGGIQLKLLPKNAGACTRSQVSRRYARLNKIREYLWGKQGNFRPVVQAIDYPQMSVVRIVSVHKEKDQTQLAVQQVIPSRDLVGAALGISHAPTIQEVLNYNIAGFVFVADIDERNQKLIIQSPCPGPLPGYFFIFGSVKMR